MAVNLHCALNTVHPKLGVCTRPCCLNKFIPHTGSHWSWSAFQPWSGNLLVYRDPNTWQSQLTISVWLIGIGGWIEGLWLVVHTLIHSCWLWPSLIAHLLLLTGLVVRFFPFEVTLLKLTLSLLLYFLLSLFSFSYMRVHSFFLGYIGVYSSSSLWFSLPSPAKVSHYVTTKSLNYFFFWYFNFFSLSLLLFLFFFFIQTRDDFLGQVDVPLTHLPVSLCALMFLK